MSSAMDAPHFPQAMAFAWQVAKIDWQNKYACLSTEKLPWHQL
jgi:hypothetical protein